MPEYIGYCTDCGARHAVGLELHPEERGCMCGGDIKAVADMDLAEATEYEQDWRSAVEADP